MPAKEIKELRQSGKLEEALNLALYEFQQTPDNVWAKRNLGWVYYEYAKSNCLPEKWESFCENLKSISDLQLPVYEKMLFDQTGWLVVKLGYALLRENDNDMKKFDTLFSLIRDFHFTKPSEVYSALFKLFHRVYKTTDRYVEFAEWWNFENFMPSDYNKETSPNGSMIIALAEQAFITYAKQLLPKQTISGTIVFDKEKATFFLSELEKIEKSHPDYQYPPYYKAKLLLALGNRENMFSALLPFAKKKRNDFWVWEILSEGFPTDKEKVFACYCKGLLCPAPEEMTIHLRAKIVPLFIERQMWDEAKTEIEKIVEIRNINKWKIPGEIALYQTADWYDKANRKTDNKKVYSEFAYLAETILFNDIPEENIIVNFVNSDKKILNFISSENNRGFFKYERFLKTVHVGETFKVRFLKKEANGLCQIATVQKSDDLTLKQLYLRNFRDVIRINKNNKFGFVNDIFVMQSLCDKYSLSDGDKVKGKAIKSFDEKKKQWGWKAYEIQFDNIAF